MANDLTFIYDDRLMISPDIEAIIGAKRYSDIIRRRKTFGMIIRDEVLEGGCQDFFHLLDDADARFLAGLILENREDRLFLRIPSCIMPKEKGKLAQFVSHCAYAPEAVLVAPLSNGEAPTLFNGDDTLALLSSYDPESVHDYLLDAQSSKPTISYDLSLTNISIADQFLKYMWDATEPRSFNSTKGDRHVLRKSSQDRDKIEGEYQFFHLVPDTLKPFLIPTFDFEDDGVQASYSMERLAIPDAALQFIHNAFDEASFSDLVSRFFEFLQARPRSPSNIEKTRSVASKAILAKMDARLVQFMESESGRQVNQILATLGPSGSLDEMAVRARKVISSAIERDKTDYLTIAHGDSCFSNILFDRRTGMMRLIDPRGATNLEDAWMHPLYDIAKFSHSVLGGYDFVNNELFECSVGSDLHLELSLQTNKEHRALAEIFVEALKKHNLDVSIIRAYELSLFLSMLPLHSDHPRKLLGYTLVASKILEELEAA